MKAIRLAMSLIAVLALGSCSIFINLFDCNPSVVLTAPKTVVESGEIIHLTTTVSNAGISPSYEWFEDDVDLQIVDADYYYSRFVTTLRDVTIKVRVTTADGETASASRVVRVVPAVQYTTVRIQNLSASHDVYYLYLSAPGTGTWGPDQLRPSTIIAPGQYFDLVGVPVGTWDMQARSSVADGTTWTDMGRSIPAGGFTWGLF